MKVSTEGVLSPLQGADGIFPAGCPSRTVLDHVSSKWGVLILVALWNGAQRWSELRRRAEGISEKMLAQTLKTLEGDGFLHREAQPVIPPRVDYRLSDRGQELVAVLLPLVTRVEEHADEIVNSPGAAGSGEAVDTTVATNAADGQAAP
ncbi:DNA-binding HxlR family transcriptional regulator [Pseudarthrobacter oxydans]|uniref:winged helix-turn-helix transcriptional regulator n=1 Tax=Pseudarthrobacter oxydans TaxID=1671 RepID=UPI002781C61B|nr:helix-turn-helix domain-containing protein [Pseudarthrobacter oxydans]MDP9983766.1 DNA-binding HxlR family transcriptional regulator [Pseudarthrobacter oxydans]